MLINQNNKNNKKLEYAQAEKFSAFGSYDLAKRGTFKATTLNPEPKLNFTEQAN